MRNFAELSEQEILALAVSLEEEDQRVYLEYAHGLADNYPASAQMFTEMAQEESEHRRRLIEIYRQRFGEHIPLIRRQDVRGFVQHEPIWMVRPLGLDAVRHQAEEREVRDAAASTSARRSVRPMPACASCWAISQRPRQGMRRSRRSSARST